MVCMHSIADSWQIFPARQVENSADSGPLLFCTDSANIFINPRLTCCKTEEGGEGERDTGITNGKGCHEAHSLRLPAAPTH